MAARKLTPKQRMFVKEYLTDLNATQAAIRAGYSRKTAESQGSRLLRNAKVAAAVQEGVKAREERVDLTADYVLGSLKEVVQRCMVRQPVMVRDGKDWVQKTDADGEGVWEFNSAGANRALELLGKHLRLFVDQVEHAGKNGGPIPLAYAIDIEGLSPEEARETLAKVRELRSLLRTAT